MFRRCMNESESVYGTDRRLQRIRQIGVAISLMLLGAGSHPARVFEIQGAQGPSDSRGRDSGVTDIAIDSTVIQNGVERLGISIPAQNYWDSGQVLRNLVFRNPGFEGEIWQ